MMTIILAILLIIVSVLLIAQSWLLRKVVRRNNQLTIHLNKSQQDYEALDQGLCEQEENYEQQFLSFLEKIEALEMESGWKSALIEDFEHQIAFHRYNCLPHLAHIREDCKIDAQSE